MTLHRTRYVGWSLWLLAAVLTFSPAVLSFEDDVFLGTQGSDALILAKSDRDFLGSSVAVGDVSGDGIADILMSAPQSDGLRNNREDSGEVAVVFGGTLRTEPIDVRVAARHTFFGRSERANLGHSLGIGDIDGDTVGDIIMGAPKADSPAQAASGSVYMFYGGGRLPASSTIDLADVQADVTVHGTMDDGKLGTAIATGDFNDDGFQDVAISAPNEGLQYGRFHSGVIYVLLGQAGLESGAEFVARAAPPFSRHSIAILGPTVESRAGRTLIAGDINDDGIDDLALSISIANPTGGPDSGNVYVLFGNATRFSAHETVAIEIDLGDPAQVDQRIIGPQGGDRFGRALGVADINGDEKLDLLMGASTSRVTVDLTTGRAYALFGPLEQRGPRALSMEPADVTVTGPHDDAALGTSVTGGDLNGDAFDEWIVGAPGADRVGQAYRIIGRPTWSAHGAFGSLTQGKRAGDEAGTATAVGDVDGDGVDDLVVGSPSFDGQPPSDATRHGGAVYVVYGHEEPCVPGPDCDDVDDDGLSPQGRTCGPVDCDDNDPDIQHDLEDVCTNCDGFVTFEGADADRDGWPAKPDAECIIPDCNDNDPAINPGAAENCHDGIDNNCDGALDGVDEECGGPGPPAICIPTSEGDACDDALDNDCDGFIDGLDPDCGGGGDLCAFSEALCCTDGLDNDRDGKIDAQDVDCGACDPSDPAVNPALPESVCGDEIDNDCDGTVDGVDTDCGGYGCNETDPAVDRDGAEICGDGIDNDCDGAMDGADTECGGDGCDENNPAVDRNGGENCADGIDNNCDRAVDAVDLRCGGPGCPTNDPSVDPDGPEVCGDGIDNDCNGFIDGQDVQCGAPPTGTFEICTNCIDDDGDGLTDMLDPGCTPIPLTLKTAVVKRPRKTPTMIKSLTVRTSLPDAALLSDTNLGLNRDGGSTGTTAASQPGVITPGVTVGLAFDDGSQFCIPLGNVKQKRKGKLTSFMNTTKPKGVLKVKRTKKGVLKILYKQQGRVELPTTEPRAMAFGLYSAEQPYSGVAALKVKKTKLIAN
jgi:hypothetical protein